MAKTKKFNLLKDVKNYLLKTIEVFPIEIKFISYFDGVVISVYHKDRQLRLTTSSYCPVTNYVTHVNMVYNKNKEIFEEYYDEGYAVT